MRICVLVIILVLLPLSGGFLWRRRRRRCSRVNCAWDNWGTWSRCSDPCGNAGTQSRSRGIRRQAACGGSACSGARTQTRACNRFCNNGGTPRRGSCSCTEPFWNTCCQTPCTSIANCVDISCTSGTNQHCKKCAYDRGGQIKAYRLINQGSYQDRVCQQICSWRSDSRYCYPGTCPEASNSCTCAPGFSGKNCMTNVNKPAISSCLSQFEVFKNGKVEEFVDVNCSVANTLVYTNERANQIKVDSTSVYEGPKALDYPQPYYVNDYKIGIISNYADLTFTRGSATIKTLRVDCNGGNNQDNPDAGIHICDKVQSFGLTPQHNDRLSVTITTTNGGFIKINNYDSSSTPSIGGAKYYSQQSTSVTSTVVFDYVHPQHCSSTGCSNNWLDVGDPYTTQGDISVSWPGWSDSLSGIKQYEIWLYKMEPYGDLIGYKSPSKSWKGSSTSTSFGLDEDDAGMYCVLLMVDDVAGNCITARRFFLYDTISNVTTRDHNQMWVDSAAQNTSYEWVTTLNDQVKIKWPGHFWNEYHYLQKLLHGVEDGNRTGDLLLEDKTGMPPSVRSVQPIPNVNGIVKYEVAALVDREGGNTTLGLPSAWLSVSDFKKEEVYIPVTRSDGDSIRVFIRGSDVMNKTVTDAVLVHVDSSPPVIEDVWLTRDGHRQLAVHNSEDLFNLTLEFKSFDIHSGLKTVHWELHDKETPGKIHGEGNPSVVTPSVHSPSCAPPDCYCIPKGNCFYQNFTLVTGKMDIPAGNHDYDYNFVITVTNNALLQQVVTYQITVDISSPHPGVVHDNSPGNYDLDYQESLTLHAWWEGFFDKQSGVLFYQYEFAPSCLTSGDFAVPEPNGVTRTTDTFASTSVSTPGRYHVTVVAYNAALEPSSPVCSDGITIDDTPPTLGSVAISSIATHEGVAADTEGQVWYINSKRERLLLVNTTTADCRSDIEVIADLETYPLMSLQQYKIDELDCTTLEDARNKAVLGDENKLEFSWFGGDTESGIYDYRVGLSSTGSADMDVSPYESTHGHRHFISYHPGLGDGSTVYIHIIATNRAGMETEKVIGPVFVYINPPTFDGTLNVSLNEYNNKEYMTTTWKQADFDESELSNSLLSEMKVAIGSTPKTENILPYTSLDGYGIPGNPCSLSSPQTCLAVPVDMLGWGLHGRHTYYLTLEIQGVNNLRTLITSEPYIHKHGPPTAGHVTEIPVNQMSDLIHDIHHQSRTDVIRIRWSGFSHPDQDISYHVGLGTSPGAVDTVPFIPTGQGKEEHRFQGLRLEDFKTYYSVVKAETQYGSTIVSSNGILILPVNVMTTDLQVKDGYRCTFVQDIQLLNLQHQPVPSDGSRCGTDLTFQTSITSLNAFWTLPSNMTSFITSVMVGIEQKDQSGNWNSMDPPTDVGIVDHVTISDLHLEDTAVYRISAALCHSDGCFLPSYSDGVQVLEDQPSGLGVKEAQYSLVSNVENGTDSFIDVTWTSPTYSGVKDPVVFNYQWNILVYHGDEYDEEYLLGWEAIEADAIIENDVKQNQTENFASFSLPHELKFASCLKFIIRAISPVHHVVASEFNVGGCDVPSREVSTVVDAVGDYRKDMDDVLDIHMEKNDIWPEPDRSYTPSKSVLSAVWPGLWHENFAWKVVSDTGVEQWTYKHTTESMKYSDYHCAGAEVLACGETKENFINVRGLTLVHAQRYHVCIFANATTANFERFSQDLPEVDICSNGVVSDHHPPEGGSVWVGGAREQCDYQVDNSNLHIYWQGFTDVEETGITDHNSGIQFYEYSIGTYPGGVEVRDYTKVGVTNMVTAHGIILQSGETYYVNVKATDFAGRSRVIHSTGVTIDNTRPTVKGNVVTDGMFVSAHNHLAASWTAIFSDPESGIKRYRWCLGTRQFHCDVVAYIETTQTKTTRIGQDVDIKDGYEYFFTVQATNGVGLHSQASSSAVILDSTSPVGGYVYDISDNTKEDVDYQADVHLYKAAWGGFNDPNSGIVSYFVTVGSCVNCDDILQETNFGKKTELELTRLQLEEGRRYYTTVRACNAAGLCNSVTSDSVIPDTTHPVMGHVLDGADGEDIEFQSSRTILAAHWMNAHDIHSGISHFSWCAGTTPGGSDVHPVTQLHLVDMVSIQLESPLPVGTRIYITVQATDKAGLSTSQTSNGFIVDSSAPVFDKPAELDTSAGSVYDDTLIWSTSLKLKWSAQDEQSQIEETYISVLSHTFDHLLIPTIKLLGDVESYTFTNVSLSDGVSYRVKMIACNRARLCTSSITQPIMVDNSPPTPGAFAVDTEHAAALTRHRDGQMTYQTLDGATTLRLAWLGFSDPHSDILQYHVIVGTGFGLADFAGESATVKVQPQTNDPHRDEGHVHKATVNLNTQLADNSEIYVTIWAENKVGLMSERLHGTFTLVPSGGGSGSLDLDRRCEVVSCVGHCTCADKHHFCHSIDSCTDKTGDTGYSDLIVKDIIDYRGTEDSDADFTRSQCAMAAKWEIRSGSSGKLPIRYEWSVGVKDEEPGSELLDQHLDSIWRETGAGGIAIFNSGGTVKNSYLDPLVDYVFYIRAWYDDQNYAVYRSDGIKTDSKPPELSKSYKVKEISGSGATADLDYISTDTGVHVTWDNVFRDVHADITGFVLSIGTYPGGNDIANQNLPSSSTYKHVTVSLEEDVQYYTTITAYNEAGLFSAAHSDGFKVDLTNPSVGFILDGLGLVDLDYLGYGERTKFGGRWGGFWDLGSGIEGYTFCVGTTPGGEDVLPCVNVSLATNHSFILPDNLATGAILYCTVTSRDGAGHVSHPLISDGVILDTSPPQPQHNFVQGPNLILNPSFEVDSVPEGEHSLTPTNWIGSGDIELVHNTSGNLQEGVTCTKITNGELSQAIVTPPGGRYKLQFYTRLDQSYYSQALGYVTLPGRHQHFSVSSMWARHVFYLEAVDSVTMVTLGGWGRRNVYLLDGVSLVLMSQGPRASLPDPDHPHAGDTEPVHVTVAYHGDYVTVTSAWDVIDPESHNAKTSWAIGTVTGGTQLQGYTSVGHHAQGRKEMLLVPHGVDIHVTVVLQNTAGLVTVLYSDPVAVDLTPPELCCLVNEDGTEITHLEREELTLKWNVHDVESIVEKCEIAAGQSPGNQNLQEWIQTADKNQTTLRFANLDKVDHVYISLRCTNYVGLTSYLHTDVIYVTMNPSDVSAMFADVITESMTLYGTRDSYQADENRILIGWGGINPIHGIDTIQARVRDGNSSLFSWVDITNIQHRYAELTNLQLGSEGLYEVDIRVANIGGEHSVTISANFTVKKSKPQLTGNDIIVAWTNDWTIEIDWSDVFDSGSGLVYEVTIGTRPGGMEVLSWTETVATDMRVSGVDSSKHQYITITAINKAGLYTTTSTMTTFN